MPVDSDQTPHTPALNETRARQGRPGRPVLWVLLISTGLAAVALFAAWGFRADDLAKVESTVGADTPAEAQGYANPQSPPRQNTQTPAP